MVPETAFPFPMPKHPILGPKYNQDSSTKLSCFVLFVLGCNNLFVNGSFRTLVHETFSCFVFFVLVANNLFVVNGLLFLSNNETQQLRKEE